jgi:hypothetical protein
MAGQSNIDSSDLKLVSRPDAATLKGLLAEHPGMTLKLDIEMAAAASADPRALVFLEMGLNTTCSTNSICFLHGLSALLIAIGSSRLPELHIPPAKPSKGHLTPAQQADPAGQSATACR